MKTNHARLFFAIRWAIGHLAISAAVGALAAALVFAVWYPSPWRQLLGVAGIFGLVVAVDLVCGPLLTLVLASPKKSRKERWVDLSLVGAIQLIALAYGLWSVFGARPVALVFEVDRLVIVSANEVLVDELPTAPEGLRALPWAGVKLAGTRGPSSSAEQLQGLDLSLQGISPAMRPSWWVPFDAVRSDALKRAKPLAELVKARPAQSALLESAAAKSGLPIKALRYLPLTSSKVLDWVALISPAGDVVGYAPVDGF
jgi:MFS family permease